MRINIENKHAQKGIFALIFSVIFSGIATQASTEEYQILPQSHIGFIGSKFLAVSVEGELHTLQGRDSHNAREARIVKGRNRGRFC